MFLPSAGVVLRGKLLFRVDAHGFHFDGGVGLSAKWPDTVRLPGCVIHSLSTSVAVSGSDFPIAATGTIVVSLGPVTVTIEGFGMAQPLRLTTDGSGNLGILDLQPPSFATPTGIGVAIDASVVKGGGFLRITDKQIAGALELTVSLGSLELSVQAFGVIQQINGELSFVVVMSVKFSPPIEIFLGLTLNAVGGVFGFNRTVDSTALRGLVRDGRTNDVLIPHDLIARADLVLSAGRDGIPGQAHAVPGRADPRTRLGPAGLARHDDRRRGVHVPEPGRDRDHRRVPDRGSEARSAAHRSSGGFRRRHRYHDRRRVVRRVVDALADRHVRRHRRHRTARRFRELRVHRRRFQSAVHAAARPDQPAAAVHLDLAERGAQYLRRRILRADSELAAVRRGDVRRGEARADSVRKDTSASTR